jgi:hypothetical protein
VISPGYLRASTLAIHAGGVRSLEPTNRERATDRSDAWPTE